MNKLILIIAALVLPCTALASPKGFGSYQDYLSQPSVSEQNQMTSAAEAGLSKALEVSSADHNDDDANIDSDEALELNLPEQDLPESDIPLALNDKVQYFIRYFQTSARPVFAKWLSRSERYIPMMRSVLKKEGLPEDLVYLAMIESGFSPRAYSVASAAGPWQFMSGTGRNYSLRIDQWMDERRDPLKSTVAAARYLKELYGLFNKDWYLAAAGYNAGENKIQRAINMYNSRDFWELSKGQYLKRETKEYVPRLLAAAIIAKEPAKYGFADVAYLPPVDFDIVKIPAQTDLEVVAKACGVSVQTLRNLNPELRRNCTPPDYPGYELKIPKGTAAQFVVEYAKIPESERYTERVKHIAYKAKRKDTLASIAHRFKTTPQAIAELNNIGKKSRSLHGRVLTIPVEVAAAKPEAESAKPAVMEAKAEPKAEQKVEQKGESGIKYYIVKKGDTLFSLAKRFNVTARVLSAWNNIKSKVALRPGKRIIVYQGKKDQEG